MVRGLDKLKEYFNGYTDNYIIIGGTACDLILSGEGFKPRATKDIDIILVIEALTPEFVKQFWKLVVDGKYRRNEKSPDERKYYRFSDPEEDEFPMQIELFARNPGLIDFDKNAHLTPIPVDDDLSSLSAILMNDDYYDFMTEHSQVEDGIRMAAIEALVCLKAKAYLDISERINNGIQEDKRHLKKHKADVFRLGVLLKATDRFVLPESIAHDLQAFIVFAQNDLPDKAVFKEMGIGTLNPQTVLDQLILSFGMKNV